MSFVLDTSVAMTWCFEDERTGPMDALLDRLVEQGGHVPQLWPIEVLNVLLVARRRNRLQQEQADRLLGFLRDLPISIDDETAGRVWSDTARLATRYRLTAYDAAYLELAVRRRLPLATADQALRVAAEAEGVALLS